MSIFTQLEAKMAQNNQQQQQQPNSQQPAGQEPAFQQSSETDPNAQQQQQQEPNSPQDKFKGLFDNDNNENENENQEDPNVFLSIDPEKLSQNIGKMNFSNIEGAEELAQNALNGDPKALMQLLNGVGQQVMSQAAQFSAGAINRAGSTMMERSGKTTSENVRGLLSGTQLQTLMPDLSPEMVPVANMVQQQILKKNPSASPSEVASMTKDYFKNFMQMFGEDDMPNPSRKNEQPELPKSQDFGNFFGG